MRWSWSAFTSSAAVRAIEASSVETTRWMRPAIVSVRDRDRAPTRPAVAIHPRPRRPAVREHYRGTTTLEIVPFRAIDGRKKFRRRQAVEFPKDPPGAFHQARVAAEIEQSSAHAALAHQRGARQHAMQPVPTHERAVREQQQGALTRIWSWPRGGRRAARPVTW